MPLETTQAAPIAEALNTAVVTTEVSGAVAPSATEDAGQTPESTEAKPEKSAEQKELEYLRRKATRADRVNARMHQELEQYRARPEPTGQPQGEPKPEAKGEVVDPIALADHIATAREVAKKSNDVVADGTKRFAATWAAALEAVLAEAGPLIDKRSMLPTPLGEAILDSDDPAALLHHLGSDPSLADELSDLSPAQLGRRIARIEADMKAKPAPRASNAPSPIKPLAGGSSNANVDLENLPMDKYREVRAKQGARWAPRR